PTRIDNIGFFLGLLWLYSETGTLLFFDGGNGCLEQGALAKLVGQTTLGGMAVSTAIALLIFCGAIGKSGQLPLHVWLPDAMEGATPVSALIHAATMVTAGVYLLHRTAWLFALTPDVLLIVAWIGAFTALLAAVLACVQDDIKRVLAYSTVSQLGYMMTAICAGFDGAGFFPRATARWPTPPCRSLAT